MTDKILDPAAAKKVLRLADKEPDTAWARYYSRDVSAALEALEEAQEFRAELEELVDGDDSTLADQIRDLMLNLDEGILRGSKEGE